MPSPRHSLIALCLHFITSTGAVASGLKGVIQGLTVGVRVSSEGRVKGRGSDLGKTCCGSTIAHQPYDSRRAGGGGGGGVTLAGWLLVSA